MGMPPGRPEVASQVGPEFAVVQDRRRVVGGDHGNSAHEEDASPGNPELGPRSRDRSQGGRTQGHDDLRPHGRDLAQQVRTAGGRLVLPRCAIPGGPALDHVGDEDRLAPDARRGQRLGQDLARRTDERSSGGVFRPPGCLADQEKAGPDRTLPRDCSRPALVETATGANPHRVRGPCQIFLPRPPVRHGARERSGASKPSRVLHERCSARRFVSSLIFGWTFSIFPSSFARTRSNLRSAFSRSTVAPFRSCWARRISAR